VHHTPPVQRGKDAAADFSSPPTEWQIQRTAARIDRVVADHGRTTAAVYARNVGHRFCSIRFVMEGTTMWWVGLASEQQPARVHKTTSGTPPPRRARMNMTWTNYHLLPPTNSSSPSSSTNRLIIQTTVVYCNQLLLFFF